MKRQIEKFPYGTGSGLSETEAKENFVNFCKEYGPLTLRIGLFTLMMASSAFAAANPVTAMGISACLITSFSTPE